MDSKNSSRRKFIKKSGAVAGVSVIPAKSVWGACNASGVSGGSRETSDPCVFSEDEFGGRSGGSWQQFLDTARVAPETSEEKYGRSAGGLQKVHSMFSLYADYQWGELANKRNDDRATRIAKGAKRLKVKKIYDYVNCVIYSAPIISLGGATNSVIPPGELSVLQGLESPSPEDPGIKKQLACIYLNIYFGFIDLPILFNSVQEYLEHLWGVYHTYEGVVPFEDVIDRNYEPNSSTDYNNFDTPGCSFG